AKAPISGAAAFVLPSTTECVKDGRITVEVRKVRHVEWTRIGVKVNGKRFATISTSRVNRPVQIDGLPSGSIAFSITAHTSDRRSVTAGRHYYSCAVKHTKPTKPTKPTTPPKSTTPTTPTPPAPPNPNPTPPASPTAPEPGLYRTNGGYAIF